MRTAVLAATLVAASISIAAPALASPSGGAITGTAWLDDNEDGLRQHTEPALSGTSLLLADTGRTVQTDEHGHYRFEDVPDGTYRLTNYITPEGLTYTKKGGDSDVDPDTGYAVVKVAGGVAQADLGYVEARPDSEVSDVDIPLIPVGTEVNMTVTYRNAGNTREALWGDVVLPDGLTPVWTDAPVGWIDGQRVHLSSMYQPPTAPGESVTCTIRVSVDEPIDGEELVATVENQRVVDPDNNVVTVEIITD